MKRPQLRCYPCRPFPWWKTDGLRINCQPCSKGLSLRKWEGRGGRGWRHVLVCRLIGKDSKRYCLNHLTQDPTRQLLKFDLSLVHRFRLRYSTTCDSYYRDWCDAIDPSSKGVIPGWDKAIYSVDNVRRHLNEDIGQVTRPVGRVYTRDNRLSFLAIFIRLCPVSFFSTGVLREGARIQYRVYQMAHRFWLLWSAGRWSHPPTVMRRGIRRRNHCHHDGNSRPKACSLCCR